MAVRVVVHLSAVAVVYSEAFREQRVVVAGEPVAGVVPGEHLEVE
jgi:hypothetical protein